MSETALYGSSEIKYIKATVLRPSITPTPSIAASPRQRVVTASHTQESVVLRFTPRAVRQSESDTKTN